MRFFTSLSTVWRIFAASWVRPSVHVTTVHVHESVRCGSTTPPDVSSDFLETLYDVYHSYVDRHVHVHAIFDIA